jgi:hypothetical protein
MSHPELHEQLPPVRPVRRPERYPWFGTALLVASVLAVAAIARITLPRAERAPPGAVVTAPAPPAAKAAAATPR